VIFYFLITPDELRYQLSLESSNERETVVNQDNEERRRVSRLRGMSQDVEDL